MPEAEAWQLRRAADAAADANGRRPPAWARLSMATRVVDAVITASPQLPADAVMAVGPMTDKLLPSVDPAMRLWSKKAEIRTFARGYLRRFVPTDGQYVAAELRSALKNAPPAVQVLQANAFSPDNPRLAFRIDGQVVLELPVITHEQGSVTPPRVLRRVYAALAAGRFFAGEAFAGVAVLPLRRPFDAVRVVGRRGEVDAPSGALWPIQVRDLLSPHAMNLVVLPLHLDPLSAHRGLEPWA